MAAKEKILIIDDDADVCDTYDAFLLDDAYDLYFAHNGGEGLVRAMEISPDLILLDVMMPDMDGFEVCNYLKSDTKLKHIPVILITALESRQALMLGFEAGADEFLPKPVRGGELRVRVRSMLRIKKLYDQLIETLCLREELVNMIVHDIKNPLSVIMGLSQVLKMQITDPGHSDYVEKIWEQGQRLNLYLTDMLMLTKLEAGSPILNCAAVDMNQLVLESEKNNKIIAQARKVDIVTELPEESRKVSVDANLFQRLLDNLISNALKFAPPETRITLRVSYPNHSSHQVRIQVADEGPGISEAHHERIFEKFEVAKLKHDGVQQVGLGLAFCKMVAEAHKGIISVEANSPKGSVFTVEI